MRVCRLVGHSKRSYEPLSEPASSSFFINRSLTSSQKRLPASRPSYDGVIRSVASSPRLTLSPIAEETGLIVPIGEWVLRQACAEAMRWPGHIRVAVNLSVAQFRGRKLVQAVTGALAESGLPGQRLELEITETVLMQNTEATLGILHQLRALDARISMDDFGTGYSSLSYLRSFPFDKVKIDRSFVHDLSGKASSIAVVRAILGLGHSLGLATTAEGVETKAQLAILQEGVCTEVQGYFFCQPKSAADLPSFFGQNDMEIAARKTV